MVSEAGGRSLIGSRARDVSCPTLCLIAGQSEQRVGPRGSDQPADGDAAGGQGAEAPAGRRRGEAEEAGGQRRGARESAEAAPSAAGGRAGRLGAARLTAQAAGAGRREKDRGSRGGPARGQGGPTPPRGPAGGAAAALQGCSQQTRSDHYGVSWKFVLWFSCVSLEMQMYVSSYVQILCPWI